MHTSTKATILRSTSLSNTTCAQDFPHELEIRTTFPRFQEYFTLIVQFKGKPLEKKTTGKMYVGRYFTEKGAFDEVRIRI